MHLILQAILNFFGLIGDIVGRRSQNSAAMDVFNGLVQRAVDGDTIDVVPAGAGSPVRIRLLFIDAPESGQLFGRESAAYLSSAQGQQVKVATSGFDVYGRLLGEVVIDDQSVNLGMVRAGWAWALPDAPADYQSAMESARSERIGLWQADEATAPWVFRKLQPATSV